LLAVGRGKAKTAIVDTKHGAPDLTARIFQGKIEVA
jgi:hypothetical protein